MDTNPMINQPVSPTAAPAGVKPICGWATVQGVMIIIGGAICSLTIIGAIVGVPMIIAGVKLTKAVTLSKEYNAYNPQKLGEAIDNLNSFFKILGIITVIYMAIMVIAVPLAMMAGIFAGMMSQH